ncbi:MAG: spore coat associated protein CotJA [Ruminococcaceae bacterium]|nr:spore coat associated protein CotJA [Oscillospiraceae bacterium]
MAYVPYQSFEDLNEPAKALECGTLFEALYMPFYGQRRRNGI